MPEELNPPIEAEINNELTERYSPPYCVIDNCLCELRMTKDNVSKKALCNFVPWITAQETVYDGEKEFNRLHLSGIAESGRSLREIEIDAKDFQSMNWLLEKWGADCNIAVGGGSREHIRFAIQSTMKQIPAVVKELSRNEALICLVDANLHRENLLPSEKAFAYKMKLDAQKALGRQGAQVVHPGKSRDIVAEGAGTSRETIRRYIRLTFLEKELLDLVDQGRIALTPAVELSYLPKEVQQEIAEIYETDEVTPSYSQSVRLRKLFENGELTENGLYEILSEQKANQKEYLRLDSNKYDRYLGRFRSVREKEDFIAEALEYYNRYLIRQRDRDSR